MQFSRCAELVAKLFTHHPDVFSVFSRLRRRHIEQLFDAVKTVFFPVGIQSVFSLPVSAGNFNVTR